MESAGDVPQHKSDEAGPSTVPKDATVMGISLKTGVKLYVLFVTAGIGTLKWPIRFEATAVNKPPKLSQWLSNFTKPLECNQEQFKDYLAFVPPMLRP